MSLTIGSPVGGNSFGDYKEFFMEVEMNVFNRVLLDHVIICEKPDEVVDYIRSSNLAWDYIVEVIHTARHSFQSSQIYLTVYVDPEIDDRYLLLLVRSHSYDQVFLHSLENFVYPDNRVNLESGNGYLLVNTDFQ